MVLVCRRPHGNLHIATPTDRSDIARQRLRQWVYGPVHSRSLALPVWKVKSSSHIKHLQFLMAPNWTRIVEFDQGVEFQRILDVRE
jgi:hypothetical protein